MNTIELSIDSQAFSSKPSGQDVPKISTRIAKSPTTLKLSEINKFINSVATEGHTFCPATFKDGKRSKETFEQQQIFALDFDNKDPKQTISFEEVKARANYYDLPILFAYDTFSSTEHDKFRVIFLNDTSICHRKVAEAIQLALGEIFPEADSSCYKDVSKIYFGGKREIYRGISTSTINVDTVFRGLTYHLKDTKGNHYKEWIFKFSEETGIGLNTNGFLDVMVSGDPTEYFGVSQVSQNGKFSPNAIIYSPNIIPNGENLRSKYYCLKITDCTSKSSVVTSGDRTDVTNKE